MCELSVGPVPRATSAASAASRLLWPWLLSAAGILAISPLAAVSATGLYNAMSGARDAGVLAPGVLAELQALQAVVYFAALHSTMMVLTLGVARWLSPNPKAAGMVATLHLAAPGGGVRICALSTALLLAGAAAWLVLAMAFVPEMLVAGIGDYPRLVRSGWGVLLAPVLCLLAPVAEELLFRGFLFGAMSRSPLGAAVAAIASSALWAALHTGHTALARLHLFAAGLLLCWVVRRTGSVRVAIWCHVLFNTSLSLLLLAATAE